MTDVFELTEEMVDQDRREEDGRRLTQDRRIDTVTAQNWDPNKERRSNTDRRVADRRRKCMHCGESYTLRANGQTQCACRLRALQSGV